MILLLALGAYLLTGVALGTFTFVLGYGWKLSLLVTFCYPYSFYKWVKNDQTS